MLSDPQNKCLTASSYIHILKIYLVTPDRHLVDYKHEFGSHCYYKKPDTYHIHDLYQTEGEDNSERMGVVAHRPLHRVVVLQEVL